MLISIKISNYLSFKDEVEFSLNAASIKEYVDSNTFSTFNDITLLKGGVLYGANSAGKSNLIKAISFMKKFIVNSAKDLQANEDIDVEYFKLNTVTINQPSNFEIQFIQDNKHYKYSFRIDKKKIHSESLLEVLKTKERLLFSRNEQEFSLHEEFEKREQLIDLTRGNALFLSVAAQFNVATAISIIRWFDHITFLYDIHFQSYISETAKMINEPRKKRILLKILDYANLGIQDIEVEKMTLDDKFFAALPSDIRKILSGKNIDTVKVLTKHTKYDGRGTPLGPVNFDLTKEESLGTQKYFGLAGYILDSLENGKVIFVDELDAKLHPLLSTLIVKLYNDTSCNTSNAQLIFSTHNTNLMSDKLLRRDQIFIFKKNKFGGTEINTLHNLKVRNDASFEKEYLDGEYDGVPFKGIPYQLNLFDQ